MADLIIFILQVLFLFAFLYYAYIYKNLDTTTCIANAYTQVPITDSATQGINMTQKFQLAIRFGFWIAMINVIRSGLGHMAIWFNSGYLQYISYVLYALNMCLAIILFIFMNMWRWGNAGMVCSGANLGRNPTT